MRRGLTIAIASLAALALAGCGTGADERAARASVDRFEAAIQAKDGGGACRQLSDDASSKLESSESKACDQAILSVQLTPSRAVTDASVWVTGAPHGATGMEG